MDGFTSVEIFPSIGIARIGDSLEYFFAPEVPGQTALPKGPDGNPITKFRDSDQRIKRQKEDGYVLQWKVSVANTKAAAREFRGRLRPESTKFRNPDIADRNKLKITANAEISSGEQTSKELQGRFQGSKQTTVYLGQISVDTSGRLIFLGGRGRSECVEDNVKHPDIVSEFDGLDWFDDVCDGWVEVTVSKMGQRMVSRKATVISTPPKFAWGINDVTTLYDVAENIYRKEGHASIPQDTDFYRDIWPVLLNTCATAWTNNEANQGHGPDGRGYFYKLKDSLSTPPPREGQDENLSLRRHILGKIREPENPDHANTNYMPRLSGDNGDAIEPGTAKLRQLDKPIGRFGALTDLQYTRFRNWAEGKFVKGQEGGSTLPSDVQHHPELLTRAMLEQTTGGTLYPGIETYWIVKEKNMYDLRSNLIRPPFRFNYATVKPGDLTDRLSLPWQSDFDLCHTHWWPAARPDHVVDASGKRKKWSRGLRVTPEDNSAFPASTDMVKYWSRLGFVVKKDNEFKWQEDERLSIP